MKLLAATACLLVWWLGVCAAQEADYTLPAARAIYNKADNAVSESWSQTLSTLRGVRLQEAKAQHQAWLLFRKAEAERRAAKASPPLPPAQSPTYFITAARLSQDRLNWLRRVQAGTPEPLTGLWSDGQGSFLRVVALDGGLYFNFRVARKKPVSVSAFAGQVVGEGEAYRFTPQAPRGTEGALTWTRQGLYLQVQGGTGFEGRYGKVASLDEATQAAVVQAGTTGQPLAEP